MRKVSYSTWQSVSSVLEDSFDLQDDSKPFLPSFVVLTWSLYSFSPLVVLVHTQAYSFSQDINKNDKKNKI